MKTLSAEQFQQAKLDPGSVFERPEEVLASALPPDDKKTILLRWQEDADESIQATDDGMPPADDQGTEDDLLQAIQKALETLESS